MKKFAKIAAFCMAIMMLVSAFAGCGAQNTGSTDNGGTTTAPAGDGTTTIKIGGIGPVSGGAAIYGQAVKNAAEMAVEEVNALDGNIKFEFRFEDDEHDAEKSVNAYNQLKGWNMQILMGTVTSSPCAAVASKTNKDRIFTLTPSASSTDVIGGYDGLQRKDNVFQMCFSDPNQGTASAQYIKEQNLGTKIAIIYNNGDNYSTGIYQKFKAEAAKLGLEIVATQTFTDKTVDFKPQVRAAKDAGADILFLPIYYTPASLILKQANDMQYDVKVFGVDGMDGILTVENFDTSLAEGVMLLTPFSADAKDEKTQAFVTKYKEKYGTTPNQFAADAYDSIYALYDACKTQGITGDMSASDICDKLIALFTGDSFKFDGLTGESMKWSATGEVSKSPKGMVIQNGVYVGM